ncbi:UNVERIFIED_CONTAM: hypothetical protein GTU68_061652 [Idotea baltica]|nr:hypothetical protein [Idotea baltica]
MPFPHSIRLETPSNQKCQPQTPPKDLSRANFAIIDSKPSSIWCNTYGFTRVKSLTFVLIAA